MKIECPYCARHYEIDGEYANTDIKCVSCGQTFTVAIQVKKVNGPVEIKSPQWENKNLQSITGAVASCIAAQQPEGNRDTLKALICKTCGSSELEKEEDLFICQSCGTKYTAEEAQKLQISGTVNIQMDRSSGISNALINARRALKQKDWPEAERYYNLVEKYVPENMEAVFFSSYSGIRQVLTDIDESNRKEKFDAFCNIFSVMEEYYGEQDPEGMKELLFLISRNILDMLDSDFFHYGFNTGVFGYYTTGYPDYICFPGTFLGTDDKVYTDAMFLMCKIEFVKFIENLLAKTGNSWLYEILLIHYERCLTDSLLDKKVKKTILEKWKEAATHLKRLAPEAVIPEKPAQKKTVKSFNFVDFLLYFTIVFFLVIAAVVIFSVIKK